MFDILFGWRKAAKCKKLVRCVQCRLKILKKKRNSIVNHLRDDIAQLLKNGQYGSAFDRVEQLFKDQCLLASYELLDHFCEFIIIRFPYIRRHRNCPNDINEAVSTLIYAAAWCGDLPELQVIRKLFGDHFGHKFTKAAVELCPGNFVNHEVREKLCIKSIPDDVKIKSINEIAKDYSLKLGHLGCDNKLQPHLPQLCRNSNYQWEGFAFEEKALVNYNCTSRAQMQASYTKNDKADASFILELAKSMVEPHYVRTMHRSAVHVENCAQAEYLCATKMIPSKLSGQSSLETCGSNQLSTASLDKKVEIGKEAPQSEILFQFHERSVYSEEVEEFQFNTLQDQYGEDKRIFIFISSIFPQTAQNCCKMMKSNGRRLKRGHQSCPSPASSKEDVECELYHSESCKFSPNQNQFCHHDKHRRKMTPQEGKSSSVMCSEKLWPPQQLHYARMTSKHACYGMEGHRLSNKCNHHQKKSYCQFRFSHAMDFNSCLEHPCYYNVVASQNGTINKKCRIIEEAEKVSDCPASFASSHGSCTRGSSPYVESETDALAPYARTMTISPKRPKGMALDNILQSSSCQFKHSKRSTTSANSHVHPKLPDYDELVAKFMALKKEHQQKTIAASMV